MRRRGKWAGNRLRPCGRAWRLFSWSAGCVRRGFGFRLFFLGFRRGIPGAFLLGQLFPRFAPPLGQSAPPVPGDRSFRNENQRGTAGKRPPCAPGCAEYFPAPGFEFATLASRACQAWAWACHASSSWRNRRFSSANLCSRVALIDTTLGEPGRSADKHTRLSGEPGSGVPDPHGCALG